MNLLYKLERKFGKYSISGLMRYVVIINVVGAFLGIMTPGFYTQFLALDIDAVLHGQIWRLFTFVFAPGLSRTAYGIVNPIDILFFAINVYLYYWIGNSLEAAWGSFRFNLYYISGILLSIAAAIIIYISFGESFPIGLEYINQSLFLAFACLYPNQQLMLSFVIPIKVKWLGILYGIMLGYDVLQCLLYQQYAFALAIVVAVANFLIFFLATRNYRRISPREQRRKQRYKKQVRVVQGEVRHKCAICGRTEKDDENLEFRYCSRCDGNYEYCSEHLFSHEHVKR